MVDDASDLTPGTLDRPRRRSVWRSVGAVLAGFVVVIVLSLAMDQLMHSLEIYPPWGQPMDEVGDNLLALSYRCILGVLGSYVTARLAPVSPMTHVWIGAGIGFVLSLGGVIAASNVHLGPLWYPIALTVTVFPCAWVGGRLYGASR